MDAVVRGTAMGLQRFWPASLLRRRFADEMV